MRTKRVWVEEEDEEVTETGCEEVMKSMSKDARLREGHEEINEEVKADDLWRSV